jgi:hypothetical protein
MCQIVSAYLVVDFLSLSGLAAQGNVRAAAMEKVFNDELWNGQAERSHIVLSEPSTPTWTMREDKARLVMLLARPEAFTLLQMAFSDGYAPTTEGAAVRRQHLDAYRAGQLVDPFSRIADMYNDFDSWVFTNPRPDIQCLSDYLLPDKVAARSSIQRDARELRTVYSKLRTQFTVVYEKFHRSGHHVSDGNEQEISEFAGYVGTNSLMLFAFIVWRDLPVRSFSMRLMPEGAGTEVGLDDAPRQPAQDGVVDESSPSDDAPQLSSSSSRSATPIPALNTDFPTDLNESSRGPMTVATKRKAKTDGIQDVARALTTSTPAESRMADACSAMVEVMIHTRKEDLGIKKKKMRMEALQRLASDKDLDKAQRDRAYEKLLQYIFSDDDGRASPLNSESIITI